MRLSESTLEYVLTGRQTKEVPLRPVTVDATNVPTLPEFLHLLYKNCPDGTLTVTTLDPTVSYHYSLSKPGALTDAADAIQRHGATQNTYMGLCLRKPGLNAAQRGNASQLRYMTCLWADVDFMSPAHTETALPKDAAEAREFLVTFPIIPSIIINSGHGMYGIWLFEEPIDLDKDATFAQEVADGFGIYLSQQARQHGWKLDNVSDLPRMLRAPGTVNHKGEPIACTIEAVIRASNTLADGEIVLDDAAFAAYQGDYDLAARLIAEQQLKRQKLMEKGLTGDEDIDSALLQQLDEIDGPRHPLPAYTRPTEDGEDRPIIRHSRSILQYFAMYGRRDEPEQAKEIKEGNLGEADRLRQCPFIEHCVNEATTLSEPEWHTMMSITSLCSDGEQRVHDWSEAYPSYDADETTTRYNRAVRENKPCSCRFIRSRFPGICPANGCTTNDGYRVKGPITFALLTQNEQIDRIVAGKLTTDEALSENIISFAAYAKEHDPRRYALLKNAAFKAGVGKRDFENSVDAFVPLSSPDKKDHRPHNGPLSLDGAETGNLVVPADWEVSSAGIAEVKRDSRGREYTAPVSPAPVFISELFEDIDSGVVRLDLVFRSLGKWKHALITRDFAMNRGKIITLAETGFPVVSDSTGGMTRYLRDFEAVNIKLLPIRQSVARLGWKGDEFFPYYTDKPVTFIHEDVDRLKLIEAFHTQGNYGAWKTLAGKMRTTPVARAMLAVSFAAPLVEKLKRRSILLYVWFYSGAGKTAMLKTAISVWGDPDALMGDFNTTEPGLERKASALCNLPVGIDELQALDRERFSPEDLIYLLANGHGKTKANDKDSTKTMAKWRTSFIMTGEVEMINEKSPDGAHNRLISLNGRVIENSVVGSIVHEVSEKNYGWAGQEYIKYLVDEVIKVEVPVRDVERLESIAAQATQSTQSTLAPFVLANDATLAGADSATTAANFAATEDGTGAAGATQATSVLANDATRADSGMAMLIAAKNARAAGANGAGAVDATQPIQPTDDSVWANFVQVNREVEGEGQVSKLNADFNHMRNRVTRIARERGLAIGAHTDQLTMIALGDMYASISVFKEGPAAAEEEAVQLVSDMLTMMNLNAKVDVVDNAWNHLQQWIVQNKRTFITEQGGPVVNSMYPLNVPINGVFNNNGIVHILTTVANKVLEDGGYDHRKSFQGFKERGYLETRINSKGHELVQFTRRVNGVNSQKVYGLKMDVGKEEEDDERILS